MKSISDVITIFSGRNKGIIVDENEFYKNMEIDKCEESKIDGVNLEWDKVNELNYIQHSPMKFHDGLLGKNELDYVKQQAWTMNRANPDFLAISLISGAASLIGGTAIVIPKANDLSWRIKITIWGMCIGEPSSFKTPLITLGLKPLQLAQKLVLDKYNECNIDKQNLKNEIVDETIERIKKEAKELFDIGDEEGGNKIIEEASNLKKSYDAEREVICNDLTPEALLIKLQRNPLGVLMFYDELSSLFSNMSKKGREQERSLLLEGFNASESKYVQERVGREKVVVPSVHINIIGGIQPSMIATTLEDRRANKVNDGFMERFQLAVFPDPTEPEYIDATVDETSLATVNDMFLNLARLGYQEPREYRFTTDAQSAWNEWQIEFQRSLVNYTTEEQAIRIKYPALAAKLATIFHLMDVAIDKKAFEDGNFSTEIGALHLKRALLWIDYLWSHAQKIYGFNRIDLSVATLIGNLPKLGAEFTKHQLSQKCWKHLTTLKERDHALKTLEESGYIKLIKKPKKVYVVHPDYC
ncbi:TPA: DUF3987 domain-containing protein [Vibrio parahaemolyticus]